MWLKHCLCEQSSSDPSLTPAHFPPPQTYPQSGWTLMDQLSMAFSDYIASAVEQLKPHLRPTAGERSSLKTTSLVMEGEPLINQGFCRSEQERVPLFNSWALQDQPITGEPGCGSCTHYSMADLPRPGHTLGSCFPLFHSWSPYSTAGHCRTGKS